MVIVIFFSMRILAFCACIFLLAGCNKLKMGYEYADWLVMYSLEDNFEVDKVQRNHLKEDVGNYFRWHRKEMLPVYAEYLQRAADSLKTGIHPEWIDSQYFRFMDIYHATMRPVVEKAVPFLLSLSPEQIEAWGDRQKKKNAKHHKEFSGKTEDQINNRYEKIVDELEDWTGKLTTDQKAKIKTLSGVIPWNGHMWLETREKAQDHLLDLLRKKGPVDDIKKLVSDFYLNPDNLRGEEYRARYLDFNFRCKGMILAVYAILTPEQRKHFIGQVEALAQDFRKLSLEE